MKQKRSKAIDMRFYWIRDRVRQGQFRIFWRKGTMNRADYMTKHHPASHHRAIRSAYLHLPNDPTKNYFECLGDTIDTPASQPISCPDDGEGVLKSQDPGLPEPLDDASSGRPTDPRPYLSVLADKSIVCS